MLPAPLTGSGNTYAIADVLTSTTLNASIVFTSQALPSDAGGQQTFVEAFLALVGQKRVIAWTPSPTALPATLAEIPAMILQGGGSSPVTTNGSFSFQAGPTISLTFPTQQTLTATADGLTITGSTPPVIGGFSAQQFGPYVLPFTGPDRGCVQFGAFINQSALATLNWGFLFGSPGTAGGPPQTLFAPLALGDPNQTSGFTVTLDPLDSGARSNRNALLFTGKNSDRSATVLSSYYTTSTGGSAITLTPVFAPGAGDLPARLVFSYPQIAIVSTQYFTLQPDGDFILSLTTGNEPKAQLLCGLQGAEYLVFQPPSNTYGGDRLRFSCGNSAFVPTFPFPISSPVAPPFDPTSSPLNGTWTGSWATIRPPSGEPASIIAVAQPPGFNLFGQDGVIHSAYANLLGHADPGTMLPASPQSPFPLVPYLDVTPAVNGIPGGDPMFKATTTFSAQQVADFEAQVLGPQRHASIIRSEKATKRVVSAHRKMRRHTAPATAGEQTLCPNGTTQVNVTTPSGYLVTMCEDTSTGTATWSKLLLAKLIESKQELAFLNPVAKLEQAFQAGQLMLVVANSQYTGGFENELTIGGWTMAADVGSGSRYGDYANILIVKAVPGALYDPNASDPTTNLVANPTKWTMAGDFAAPSTVGPDGSPLPPDPSQLANLSLWLQDYFAAAFAEDALDPQYFDSFCALARDPNWTGVLVLRGDIVKPPEGIAGITAGVSDPASFNVHHLAIPITPVKNTKSGLEINESSSVSGLIYYLDPQANPASPSSPIPAAPGVPYAFRLLSLKVLFENSALKAFSSFVQITLRSLFGSDASSADPVDDDAIVLSGSYQLVDKQPIYSMASTADSPFTLENNVLQRVEITGVQMSTVKADPKGQTVSAFAMGGYLDFAIVPGTNYRSAAPANPQSIDLFGYGNLSGASVPRQGLAFQALTLTMSFPTPQLSPKAPPPKPNFVLSTDAMRFDLGTSTAPRDGSLVKEFNLQLTQAYTPASGDPAALGFLPVVAMIPAGDLGKTWNGLVFRIDLGTPGNLASAAGLNSSLLLAWSPSAPASDGSFDVQVGLQLPGTAQGAPLISLQNVLKLSIGQIALAYTSTADKGAAKRYGFLLVLNEIAMVFLGLLKIPPNGATSFYLFGDPAGADALGWYAIYNNEPPSKKGAGAKQLVALSEVQS